MSYLGLISNQSLLYKFEAALKSAVAEEAGHRVLTDDVALTLSAGSVVASASVAARGEDAGALQKRLNHSSTLSRTVLTRISDIEGLEQVAMGDVSVSHVSAPLRTAEGGGVREDIADDEEATCCAPGSSSTPYSQFLPLAIGVPLLCCAGLVLVPQLRERCGRLVGAAAGSAAGGGGKRTRGLALEEGHQEMLVVSSETPRTVRSSKSTPRSVLSSARSALSGSTVSTARDSACSATSGASQVSATQPIGWFDSAPGYQPVPTKAVEVPTCSRIVDLVTVEPGGLRIQIGTSPPAGVPMVVFPKVAAE